MGTVGFIDLFVVARILVDLGLSNTFDFKGICTEIVFYYIFFSIKQEGGFVGIYYC